MNNVIKRINYSNARKALWDMDAESVAKNYFEINKVSVLELTILWLTKKRAYIVSEILKDLKRSRAESLQEELSFLAAKIYDETIFRFIAKLHSETKENNLEWYEIRPIWSNIVYEVCKNFEKQGTPQ